MKLHKLLIPFCFFCLIASLTSCVEDVTEKEVTHYTDDQFATLTKSLDVPETPYSYSVEFPPALVINGFAPRAYIDDDMATLGRVLFYDKSLSKNGTIACASCHKAENGFSDNKRFSTGFEGGLTTRNSLALGTTINFNVYYGSGAEPAFFLWDERARTISDQSKIALTDPVEMGLTEQEIVDIVNSKDYYNVLIQKAFGYIGYEDAPADNYMITAALQEFVNSLSTTDSKFDRGLAEVPGFDETIDFENFTEEENLGKSLFYENCGSCHGDKFNRVIKATANNGLDLNYADKGVGGITGSEKNGVFKVPSIRNVAITSPYMHDGRFETLEEVIDHYSENIANHENLSEFLKDNDGQAKKFNFTTQEKSALIAFLNSLTDLSVTTDERYMDPFFQ
jgi:cytochrome c peroxidase